MGEKEVLPKGANWLTPYLTVEDPGASINFYEKAFGFNRGNVMEGKDGNIMHVEMGYQGTTIIMFAPENAWGSTMKTPAHSKVELPINLYVYCENVDSIANLARAAGAQVLMEPIDMFWGDRIAKILDPDGYLWTFATKVGEFDPSKMPPM